MEAHVQDASPTNSTAYDMLSFYSPCRVYATRKLERTGHKNQADQRRHDMIVVFCSMRPPRVKATNRDKHCPCVRHHNELPELFHDSQSYNYLT